MRQFMISILTSFHGRQRPWYLTVLAAVYAFAVLHNAVGIIESSLPWPPGGLFGRHLMLLGLSAYLAWGLWTGNEDAAKYLIWWGAFVAIAPLVAFAYRIVKHGWSLKELGAFVVSGMGVALVVAVRAKTARRFFSA